MISWILRVAAVAVLFLAIHGISALAGGVLPWWGSLLAATGTYVVVGLALKAMFFRLMTAPFKAKGAPLKGARLVVHSVTAVAAPVAKPRLVLAHAGGGCDEDACEGEETTDSTPADWRWYCLDATVSPPAMSEGPFRGWQPSELRIVPVDADTSPRASTDAEDCAEIKSVEYFEDGSFVADEGMSFEGERRLRMTIACAPELSTAKLRYYFEGFGRIDLPKA